MEAQPIRPPQKLSEAASVAFLHARAADAQLALGEGGERGGDRGSSKGALRGF